MRALHVAVVFLFRSHHRHGSRSVDTSKPQRTHAHDTHARSLTHTENANKQHKHNKAADLTTLAVCRLRDALHVENLPGEVVDAGKHDDGDAFTLFLYDATDLVHAERLLALRGVGVLV